MSEEIKCPVCGKAGIQDYHSKDIICPCCGSDLSIFRVIDQIPDSSSQKKSIIWKSITAIACAFALALSWNYYIHSKAITKQKVEYAQLQDSLNVVKSELSNLQKEVSIKQPIEFLSGYKYVVRKGDSFWKISTRFYNTGAKCSDIAKWNNIDINETLTPGDTLIIK